jgi:hypothetical protein
VVKKKYMSNPVITAIKSGNAPKPARLAAARGMLPLSQEDLIEILVLLCRDPEEDVRTAAQGTLNGVDPKTLLPIAQNQKASSEILGFMAVWEKSTQRILEAIILNESTPDPAIAQLARRLVSGSLLEAITINQQRLIRHPDIIEAILKNPKRTPEAERRVKEVKTEFFEKQFGVSLIAEEQKARLRLSQALGTEVSEEEFLRVLSQFEFDSGVKIEENEALLPDPEAELRRMLYEAELEGEEVTQQKKSKFQLIAIMKVKERIYLALKGDREDRLILARDPNRMVSSAVLKNPKISDAEVEAITKLKWINEEVLRLIAMSRHWTTNYSIMHNLVLNPRTPLTFTMTFLNRLQNKDLKALCKNKGVPDVLRNLANRLITQRQPHG